MAVPPAVAETLMADAASLRRLAASLLGREDAEDVVQDGFAALLAQTGGALRHPGLWLRGAVRRLSLLARRSDARRRARERLAACAEAHSHDAAQVAMQAELVRDVGLAVHALQEPFRTTVLLRFWHDLPVHAIAMRLGVPHNTVRSRLQRGLARLREQLDQEHGDRARWAAPLGAFLPLRAPALAAFILSLMNKKVLVGAAALLLAALSIPWLLQEAPAGSQAATAGSPLVVAPAAAATAGREDAPRRETVATPQPETATTGALVVRVLHEREPKIGSGLTVTVSRPRTDFRLGLLRADTDADGMARFTNVEPGNVSVRSNLPNGSVTADVRAGSTTECTLQLRGYDMSGVVVDAAGAGIAGALLEIAQGAIVSEPHLSAITAAVDGTFTVRDIGADVLLVGARAAGYAASQMYSFDRACEQPIRIVLRNPGGCVAGRVVRDDGAPLAGALVRVGEGRTDFIIATPQGAPPLPAQLLTDAAGRFLAVGVPPGTQPVSVRALGLAPWSGTCDVFAGLTASVDVLLHAGVTVTGVVRTEAGEPAANVAAKCGRTGDFLQYYACTGVDGTFTLAGLPVGESELWASDPPRGKASERVRGEAGATVRCDLQLSNGIVLRGRVSGEDGKPLFGALVKCSAEVDGKRWSDRSGTDESGRFHVPDCPEGRLVDVRVTLRNHVTMDRQGVDPKAGELDIRLSPDRTPLVRITGRILDVDGQPAVDVQVRASREVGEYSDVTDTQTKDGAFAFEVPAATWELLVKKHGRPMVRVGPRDVRAELPWDVGTLQLTRGGTLVVRDGGRKEFDYLLLDAHEQSCGGLLSPVPPLRSDLLAPGEHVLLVRGKELAVQALPFTIRSDQETELEVRPLAGVRQRFECVHATGGELPHWLSLLVRGRGRLAGWCAIRREVSGSLTGEAWFEPGEYELATRDGKLRGAVAFTVGREEGPPVRITVR